MCRSRFHEVPVALVVIGLPMRVTAPHFIAAIIKLRPELDGRAAKNASGVP